MHILTVIFHEGDPSTHDGTETEAVQDAAKAIGLAGYDGIERAFVVEVDERGEPTGYVRNSIHDIYHAMTVSHHAAKAEVEAQRKFEADMRRRLEVV